MYRGQSRLTARYWSAYVPQGSTTSITIFAKVGPRGDDGTFYAGYFRDLDGNKLNAFCFGGGSTDD